MKGWCHENTTITKSRCSLERSEIFPNGLRSKIISRPENKFTHFSAEQRFVPCGTKVCSVRKDCEYFLSAEQIFFPCFLKKILWSGVGEQAFFPRNKLFFRTEIFFFWSFPHGTKFCSVRKSIFPSGKSKQIFFPPGKKKKRPIGTFSEVSCGF